VVEHHASGKGRTISSAVLLGLGGLLAIAVPFLPWERGILNSGEPSDAFELARLGTDLRFLAYVILGVGILGIVGGVGFLVGEPRLGVSSAVAASIVAFMVTMAVVAGIAFAQMLGLGLPALLRSDPGYSFPSALIALAVATILMLGGTILSLRTRTPRRPSRGRL
jgi:hypothetical protein